MRVTSLRLLLPILALVACSGDSGASDSNGSTSGSAGTTSGGTTDGTSAGTSGGGTESGSSSGSMTTGGSAGGGMYCTEQCQVDADCLIDGADNGFKCVSSYCQKDVGGLCTGDAECVALLSGWVLACNNDNECPGQICIDDGGKGVCANAPSDFLMCDQLGMDEVQAKAYPGGESVTACANSNAKCDSGVCVDPCASDADCANFPDGYKHCNVGTGLCGCASDSECAGVIDASVCVDGLCRCASDADCTSLPYADACYDGFCGCSSGAACNDYPPTFDGTKVGCGG